MKTSFTRSLTFGSLLLTLGLSSCVDPYYGGGYGGGGYGGGYYPRSSSSGTVAGALIGAGAGGIIGNQRHRGLEGAAIGGILGALAGSMMSNGQRGYSQPYPSYGNANYNQGCNNRGYSQPNYGYGPQGGYSQPSYGYGQQGGYGNPGYYQQPSSNPYAFGNWQ